MSATRVIKVRSGDSLRLIALRELGDAMRWGEISRLNALRYPYIIASVDPDDRDPGTVIWGDSLQIPIGYAASTPLDPEVLYGRDITLSQGNPIAVDGDWSMIEGENNLADALQRRVVTPMGDLLPHADFGCDVHQTLGFKLKPIALLLGAGYVKSSLMKDPRVQQVFKITPDESGDTVRYAVEIIPIQGTEPLDINLVLPWSVIT